VQAIEEENLRMRAEIAQLRASYYYGYNFNWDGGACRGRKSKSI
jgi:hypothetical protein